MDNSLILIIIISIGVTIPSILLWIISSRLQTVIAMLIKIQKIKIKFLDESRNG